MRFSARRIGAIGITETFVEDREAEDPEAAKLALYDKYEHISVGQCWEVSDP
jgi:hypothetical protein